MKGFAAFFALLLITSTASLPITLDTAGIPACLASVGGCAFSALVVLSGYPPTAVETADVTVKNTGALPSLVILAVDTKCKSLGITGVTTVSNAAGTTTTLDGPMTIGKDAAFSVAGVLVTDFAGITGTIQTTVAGALIMASTAQAFCKAGLQVSSTGVVTLADNARMQISGTRHTVAGVIIVGKAAVVQYVDTTLILIGAIKTALDGQVVVIGTTIKAYGAAGASAGFQLAGGAVLQVQGAVASMLKIAVTGKNNVVVIAQNSYLAITQTVVVAVGGTLQFIGTFIIQHELVVYGDITFSPGDCNAYPTLGGGIVSTMGGNTFIEANTTVMNQVSSVIGGAITLAGGAAYTVSGGVHTVMQMTVTATNAGIMAMDDSVLQINKFYSTVKESMTVIGNVVINVSP